MDPDLGLTAALLIAGLLLTEFGAAGGAALATLPRHRRPGGERPSPAAVVEWAAYHRTRLEPTLLVVQTTGVVVLTTTLGHNLFEAQGPSGEMALLTALTAIVLTAFTQVSAWGLATRRPERALRALALPMRLALWAATPVIAPAAFFVRLLVRRPQPAPQDEPTPQEAETAAAVEAAVEEVGEDLGTLEERERTMIRNILDMEFTTVREVMVPRLDMVACPDDEPLAAAVELVLRHGVSRIPLYRDTVDHITGVVYAKDLLLALHTQRGGDPLPTLARTPYFVPETKRCDELLHDLLAQRVHLAVVVDEYGGVAGLVSLEDLLEEIVGDIADEYDSGETTIEPVSATEAVLDARVSIDDMNDVLGTALTSDEVDTVGGLVYAHLGRIPSLGDEVHVDGVTLTVEATLGRRIKRVRAARRNGEAADATANGTGETGAP